MALAVLALAQTLRAQIPPLDPNSGGSHYVVAFPDTISNLTNPRFPNPMPNIFSMFIYSPVDNQVTVVGASYSKSVFVKGGTFATVTIRSEAIYTEDVLVDGAGVVSGNTFRVDGQSPFILHCNMTTTSGGEMWAPIPVDRWGKDYIVAATAGEVLVDMGVDAQLQDVRRNKMGSAEVVIIAAYDNTTVNIYPTASIIAAPLSVVLNANEAYEIRSLVDTLSSHSGFSQPDIGGTRIIASRPVGVISGNARAQVTVDATASSGNSLKSMGMEWLAPIEQYGTEFVYMPTWDTRHLTGAASEKVGEKRGFELTRLNGTSPQSARVFFVQDEHTTDTSLISIGRLRDFKIPAIKPHRIRTEKPVQAMMHSASVARNNGAISPANFSYDTWAAYTVELVPREQWTTFAPYYAPSYPFETQHYINVVTDTNSLDMIYDEYGAPFDFNMGPIAGTDLMWGTYRIDPGRTHYLEGRNGTKFFAYMYGTRQGYEQDVPSQEAIALSYGLPLAPQRRILRAGDSLRIDTVRDACSMRISVHAVNNDPVGLRSAALDAGAVNLRFTIVEPAGPGGVIGYSDAVFTVAPIDPLRDASGTVVITDRTGKTRRVNYSYAADRITFNAGSLVDFGLVNLNETKDTVITVTNPLNREICVRNVRLSQGVEALSIVSSEPTVPSSTPPGIVYIPPGGTLRVKVRGTPVVKNRTYRDTLHVTLCCSEFTMPLRLGSAVPCIEVGDLDFGKLTINQERTLDLPICNQGGGTLTLNNPAGDSVITWLAANFRIDSARLVALRNTVLTAGACVNVPVTFSSSVPDTFEITARVWANTRECRDTSVWRAMVSVPTSVAPDDLRLGLAITRIYPDPAVARVGITYRLATAAGARIEIYNAIGDKVATLYNEHAVGEGTMVWDASGQPSGIYYCRLISGASVATRSLRIRR